MKTPTPPTNRRQFLRGTLGAIAAVPLGACAASADPPRQEPAKPERDEPSNPENGRSIPKAVKIGMVKTPGSLQEKFQLLRRLGFDGVELDSPSSLDPDEVLRARDATGLKIHGVVDSVHWQSTLSDPDPEIRSRGLEALKTAIRDSHRYGGDTVLLVPAVVNDRVSYGDAYARSQDEVRKALPLAAELKIKIAFENVWNNFLLSPLEAAQYVDEFDSPWVGWYFDVGNIVRYGWPEHWVRILGKRILKLDIKEYSRRKRDQEGLWKGFAVKLLEGDCGWPRVMKALDEVGFEGWATAEVGGGDEARLRDIAERMDRIIAS